MSATIKDNKAFSDLALNAMGVLGNFTLQLKRVLPKQDSQALSFVKCLSFISTANNFNLASKDIKMASHIKDSHGVKLNEVKLARSSMQFISGVLYFSSMGLSSIGRLTSWKVVIVTSDFFSKATTFLGNSAVMLLLLNTCMRLHEQAEFQQELAELQNRSGISPKQKAQDIAMFLKEQLKVSKQVQKDAKGVLRERYNGDTEKIHRIFSRAISKKMKAKEAYIKRVTDKNCIELIKKMDRTDPSNIMDTVQKIQDVVDKNIRFNMFLVGLGCTGLLGVAVSFIPGSVFATLSTILGLVPTVAFSASGLKDLIHSLQSNKEGTYDRLLLVATGCVGIVTSTALYACTESPQVKAIAALLALVWTTLLYYTSLHLDNHLIKA